MSTKYLDTRDLYERKTELEDLRDTLNSAREERDNAQNELDAHNATEIPADSDDWYEKKSELEFAVSKAEDEVALAEADFGPDEEAELRELEELENEMDARSFRSGVQLVPESDFEDHARDEAEQLGLIPDDAQWPCTCIDWEQAADALRQDYTSVTFQGTDYLYRE